jgi:hypothetical protein
LDAPDLKYLLVRLDEGLADKKRRESTKYEVRLEALTQLRDVIGRLRQPLAERQQRERERAFSEDAIPAEDAKNLLEEQVAATRRKMGLIVPSNRK